MQKDPFRRHARVHKRGEQLSRKVSVDAALILRYAAPDSAHLVVSLIDSELRYFWGLLAFRLRFCVACGRFIGFADGHPENICWICEPELEDDADDSFNRSI
jgi:hypothetical protein